MNLPHDPTLNSEMGRLFPPQLGENLSIEARAFQSVIKYYHSQMSTTENLLLVDVAHQDQGIYGNKFLHSTRHQPYF